MMPIFFRNMLCASGLAAIAAFYLWLQWSPSVPILGGDHAAYLLMADHFSLFGGRDSELIRFSLDFVYFPPLYPLVLGLVGATSSHIELAHAVTMTFLAAALVVYFLWVHGLTQSRIRAFLMVSIFAFMPSVFLQSFGILSEPLYLFLSLVAVWLLRSADVSSSRLYAAALIIGLATITRTVGIALVAAFAAFLFLHGRKSWVRPVMLSLVPLLGWNVVKRVLDYPGNYIWIMDSILEKKSLSYMLLEKPLNELHGLWVGWITGIDHAPVLASMILGSILALVCLGGAVHRAWMKQFDGLYVLVYLGILVIWPSTPDARRFLFVVLPILLIQGFLLLARLGRRFLPSWPAASPYAYILVLALAIFPPVSLLFHRLAVAVEDSNWTQARSIYWYQGDNVTKVLEHNRLQIEAKDRFVRSWRRIAEHVGRDECVYSVDPLWVMLYSDRPSSLTPKANSREQFFERATRCRYAYIAHYVHPPYLMFYPREYLEGGRIIFADNIDHGQQAKVLGMLIEMPVPETTGNRIDNSTAASRP